MFIDTSIVHTKKVSLKEAIIVLSIILFLGAILLIPIHQSATMRSLAVRLSKTYREYTLLSEKEQLLKAYIAKSSIPDVAFQTAIEQEIDLEKIPFHKAKLVIVKEGE